MNILEAKNTVKEIKLVDAQQQDGERWSGLEDWTIEITQFEQRDIEWKKINRISGLVRL